MGERITQDHNKIPGEYKRSSFWYVVLSLQPISVTICPCLSFSFVSFLFFYFIFVYFFKLCQKNLRK